MLDVCEETANFVLACDAIHARLANGGTLSPDDQELIVCNGSDLLRKVTPV